MADSDNRRMSAGLRAPALACAEGAGPGAGPRRRSRKETLPRVMDGRVAASDPRSRGFGVVASPRCAQSNTAALKTSVMPGPWLKHA